MLRKVIITVLLLLLAMTLVASAQELPIGPVPAPPPPMPRAQAAIPVFASWQLMFAAGRAEQQPAQQAHRCNCSCGCCERHRSNQPAQPGEHRH